MAEPLKNSFNQSFIDRIAQMFATVAPRLDWEQFKQQARVGFESLELMDRARQISDCLAQVLPKDFPQAARMIIDSMGPAHETEQHSGMEGFLYLPHSMFIAKYGVDFFEEGMRANYELTQRFTAEFSIRPFIQKYPQQSLALFESWVVDPNVHVRRLVSEGTRPRLPWAGALKTFEKRPETMIHLLSRLRDDSHEYVRRSVANHLNDIGKVHPALLVQTCSEWMTGANPNRQRLIRHALRSLVKEGHPDALKILGFSALLCLKISESKISPAKPSIGASLTVEFVVANSSSQTQAVLIDLKVHYMKANGKLAPKVFKVAQFELAAGCNKSIVYRLSLRQMTTRTHFVGEHRVGVLLNGNHHHLGEFFLQA